MSTEEKARLMVDAVKSALANGCLHYDPDTNELLSTTKAILTCMAAKGSVVVKKVDTSMVPRDAREVYLNEKGEVMAWCPKDGLTVPDFQRSDFYKANKDRLDQLVVRARQKNEIGDGPWGVVCIDVDDPTWTDFVEVVMPGSDWSQFRANGMTPVARGVLPLDLLKDVVQVRFPAASDEFREDKINVVVLAFGGASVFHGDPK